SRTGEVFRYDLSDDSEFGAGNGDTFFEDSRGRIWIKCRYALAWFEPETGDIHHYPMKGFTAPLYSTYAEDPDGHIWVSSITGWVGRVNLDHPDRIDIRHDIGSVDLGVLTFQMDTAGMLWCAMPDKLVRLNTRTGERAYFPYSHDLRSRSLFCMTLMPDNQLVFLSRDYIFLFDPATAGIPYPLPRPYITGIDIREQPLQTDTVIRHLSELHLAPHENFFSISFS